MPIAHATIFTMNYFQGIILGALQGATELFPVSSLGHSVILPSLFGWTIDQNAPFFVMFLVATHAATALILFFYFFKDWVRILKEHGRLLWLLVIGTIPAGLLGLLFEKKLTTLFASPIIVAIFLALNGLMLYGAEWLRKKHAIGVPFVKGVPSDSEAGDLSSNLNRLSLLQAFKIGCAQAIALLPGFSRTGATLSGGLLVGLSHEDAARFAFLLATPIIGAAAVLKLPGLIAHSSSYPLGPIIAGAIAAAIGAYLSVRFLAKYFQTKTLKPFAFYCLAAGIVSLLVLLVI